MFNEFLNLSLHPFGIVWQFCENCISSKSIQPTKQQPQNPKQQQQNEANKINKTSTFYFNIGNISAYTHTYRYTFYFLKTKRNKIKKEQLHHPAYNLKETPPYKSTISGNVAIQPTSQPTSGQQPRAWRKETCYSFKVAVAHVSVCVCVGGAQVHATNHCNQNNNESLQ